jgi:hypothetical protein
MDLRALNKGIEQYMNTALINKYSCIFQLNMEFNFGFLLYKPTFSQPQLRSALIWEDPFTKRKGGETVIYSQNQLHTMQRAANKLPMVS